MKKIISVILCLATLLACTACSGGLNKKQRYTSSFLDLFDTASTVIAYDTSQADFDKHLKLFHNKLEEYDRLFDIYNSYDNLTNLNTLNKTAKDGPVKVDERIIDLLLYSKEAYDLSGGQTNICFGSVLKLWHNCREAAINNPEKAALPDIDDLKAASRHTDINSLIINSEEGTVYYADPELQLDVGAIAKGYAVEKACRWASEELWSSGAISIGGNVYTFGYKNDDGKTLWNIGIENPDTSADDYLLYVKLTDVSVVTSGDYQRYYTVDGKKYCHIININTLMPSEYVASVSVICKNSALGDALSTSLFNMPVDKGLELVEGLDGVEAVWVNKNYEKTFSSGFEDYIKEK